MTKKYNNLYLAIFIISAILGFIAAIGVRDWVFQNNIHDFGIVGTLPSFFITFGSCFLVIRSSIKKPMQKMAIVPIITTLDEFSQIWRINKTFDYLDLIAIIIGFSLAVTLFKLLNAKQT